MEGEYQAPRAGCSGSRCKWIFCILQLKHKKCPNSLPPAFSPLQPHPQLHLPSLSEGRGAYICTTHQKGGSVCALFPFLFFSHAQKKLKPFPDPKRSWQGRQKGGG